MQSSSAQSPADENSEGVDAALEQDSVLFQDSSAQKRVQLGLSPRRPTAQSVTQRPPHNTSTIAPGLLLGILVVIVVATLLLIAGNVGVGFSRWQAPKILAESSPPVAVERGDEAAALVYELRISDDFGQATSLLAEGDQPGEWRIEQVPTAATYRMEVWPNRIAWSLLKSPESGPHRLQASGTVASHTPGGFIGLVGRYQEDDSFYLFVVDGQSRYQIMLQKDGEVSVLKPWTEATYLNSAGTANILALEDDGESLRFYGNNMLLFEEATAQLMPGTIGLVGGAQEQGVAEMRFDWIQLYDLVPNAAASR